MSATPAPRHRPARADVRILEGDALAVLPLLESESVQMIGPTSPPYLNLRSYLPAGHPDKDKEIGQETEPEEFIHALVAVFRECRRILRNDGIFVLNLGDSMTGSGKGPTGKNGIGNQGKRQGFVNAPKQGKVLGNRARSGNQGATSNMAIPGMAPKSLMMLPFRVAIALQADGWILRSVIPWIKRSCMPESADDRPTNAIEYLFLFSKSQRYFWDSTAVKQPAEYGRREARGGSMWNGQRRADPRDERAGGSHATVGADPSAGRNFRNSDLFFKTWQGLLLDEDGDPLALVVNPKGNPLPHFASFPDSLVDPFMRAGTSERGCCAACGAPWVRQVERGASRYSEVMEGRSWRDVDDTAFERGIVPKRGEGGHTRLPGGQSAGDLTPKPPQTLGWAPSCTCDAPHTWRFIADDLSVCERCGASDWAARGPCVVPQTVLDPFLGSGTTLLVANQLGRAGIGIELNAEYAEMSRKRIAEDAPMLTEGAVTVEQPAQQLGLLDGPAS